MAELTTKKRKSLSKSSFAIPEKAPGSGSYPIEDEAHARNALARVSQHGTPEEKRRVRAAVHRRYPGIEMQEAAHGAVVSSGKAKKILKDGTVRGRKLTARQRRFFGALAGGEAPRKAADGVVIGDLEAGFYEADAN